MYSGYPQLAFNFSKNLSVRMHRSSLGKAILKLCLGGHDITYGIALVNVVRISFNSSFSTLMLLIDLQEMHPSCNSKKLFFLRLV